MVLAKGGKSHPQNVLRLGFGWAALSGLLVLCLNYLLLRCRGICLEKVTL